MTQTNKPVPPNLLAATEALAETLLHAEPVLAFQQAKARLDAMPDTRRLLNDLAEAQAELRRRHPRGDVTKTAVEHVRALQAEIQANAMIMEYVAAQQAALAFLPTVNQQISELVGFDFASLASRGCC